MKQLEQYIKEIEKELSGQQNIYVRAVIIDMTEDEVGAIVLGDYLTITAGQTAKGTGITLSVPVTEDLLGRVVDPLMGAQDGGATIKSKTYYPIEKVAPGIVQRKS